MPDSDSSQPAPPTIGGVLRDLKDYMGFLRDEGTRTLTLYGAPSMPAAASSPQRTAARPAERSVPPGRPPAPPPRVARPPEAGPESSASASAPTTAAPREPVDPAQAQAELARIAAAAGACTKCALHAGRKQAVPGQGRPDPEIVFVGEAPGEEEDEQGLAFVGASGQLLSKMIAAMGLERGDVHIINAIKCRPPKNRTPLPDEVAACFPYLKAQIAAMRPRVVVALGAVATKALLGPQAGVTKLRGTWQSFEGIPMMPTYHPSYLLRYPDAKRASWSDLQAVLKHLGRTPPPRKQDSETQA